MKYYILILLIVINNNNSSVLPSIPVDENVFVVFPLFLPKLQMFSLFFQINPKT